ncbi:hypothetical protein CRYUN_Cryun10bG0072800 [Craigia yunnanensis]
MNFLSFHQNKRAVNQSMLLCCKVFFSESRSRAALDTIERVARLDPETVIVNKFEDRAYNRTLFTLVSYVIHDSTGTATYSPLQQTILAMVEAAYGAINLELHSGAHPRLGVVDDIVLHPWLGHHWMKQLGLLRLQQLTLVTVPVFLYGAAHPTGKALDTIRRELGYYRPNFMGNQWAGWTMLEILSDKPNEGPTRVSRARGITMIRACPWVGLCNVPIMSTDVSVARRIARMVSAPSGGLPTVQSMALVHGEGSAEIACILLEPNRVGGSSHGLRCLLPNEGPTRVSQARGITMIGACPWVGLYNVPIMSIDVSVARRIATMVSAPGGGLPTVQSMALVHGEGSTEIACILQEPNRVGADKVQSRIKMLSAQEGLDVEKGYFTDSSAEMILDEYLNIC